MEVFILLALGLIFLMLLRRQTSALSNKSDNNSNVINYVQSMNDSRNESAQC